MISTKGGRFVKGSINGSLAKIFFTFTPFHILRGPNIFDSLLFALYEGILVILLN